MIQKEAKNMWYRTTNGKIKRIVYDIFMVQGKDLVGGYGDVFTVIDTFRRSEDALEVLDSMWYSLKHGENYFDASPWGT